MATKDRVPQLEPKMIEQIEKLSSMPAVKAAFDICAQEVERAMAEHRRLPPLPKRRIPCPCELNRYR